MKIILNIIIYQILFIKYNYLIFNKMEESIFDNKIKIGDKLTEQNNNKRALITFAKLNKFFLFLFLFAIFEFLSSIFDGKLYETKVYKNSAFIATIFYDLTNVFAGLLFYINIKKKYNNKKQINKGINYIYNDSSIIKYNTHKNILLFLLLGLMYAINDLFWVLISDANILNDEFYYLIFLLLFSKIILKVNIYRHQYFSLLIALIGCIFHIIPNLFILTIKDILPNILNFLKGINFSLFIVIIKFMMEKYYLDPLKISLIIGIITIIINIIGYVIYSLINDYDFSYFTDCLDFSFFKNKLVISIYIILFFLFQTASQLTLFLSIFYFSPTHIMVNFIMNSLFWWIYQIITEKNTITEIILYPIGYILALFSAFIYNEIIILNCCGLNKNTKKYVNKRINQELEEIYKSKEIFLSEADKDSIIINNDNE